MLADGQLVQALTESPLVVTVLRRAHLQAMKLPCGRADGLFVGFAEVDLALLLQDRSGGKYPLQRCVLDSMRTIS